MDVALFFNPPAGLVNTRGGKKGYFCYLLIFSESLSTSWLYGKAISATRLYFLCLQVIILHVLCNLQIDLLFFLHFI